MVESHVGLILKKSQGEGIQSKKEPNPHHF